jgi:phage replication-related protein YjqB (UPF0714/DUF867 family)
VFDELLAHDGVEERSVLRGRFGFLAFLGGSLERLTAGIADAAAEAAGASLYAVIQPADLRWHVPSRLFDPVHSAALTGFLDHVDEVVAVHGYGRQGFFTRLLLGGADRGLAAALAGDLRAALPHYEILDDLDEIPVTLRGQHPDNPVNRARRGGVQLELPPRVRGLGPYWDDRPDPHEHRRALIDALAGFARRRMEGGSDRDGSAA